MTPIAPPNQKSTTIPGMTPIAPVVPARAKRGSVVPELKMTLRTPEIPPLDDADITIDRGIRGNNALDLPDYPNAPHVPLMDDMARLDLLSSIPAPVTRSRTASSIERAIADAEPDISFETEPEPELEPELAPMGMTAPAATPVPLAVAAPVPSVMDLELDPEPDPDRMFGADVETRDLPAAAIRRSRWSSGPPGAPTSGRHRRASPRSGRRPARCPSPRACRHARARRRPRSRRSRPAISASVPVRLPTEEESTAQLQIPRPPVVGQGRASRQTPAARGTRRPTSSTRPRSSIFDAVDRDAPPDELREDRTRRRIRALLEHASQWVASGEPDKAVAAIDLALAEDSTSPLAQKLIHRNQNAIMPSSRPTSGISSASRASRDRSRSSRPHRSARARRSCCRASMACCRSTRSSTCPGCLVSRPIATSVSCSCEESSSEPVETSPARVLGRPRHVGRHPLDQREVRLRDRRLLRRRRPGRGSRGRAQEGAARRAPTPPSSTICARRSSATTCSRRSAPARSTRASTCSAPRSRGRASPRA